MQFHSAQITPVEIHQIERGRAGSAGPNVLLLMIAGLIMCASLTAVDGDTVKCDGQNMRLLGEGVPFESGIDAPEIGSHAKCLKERKLALIAKGRLKELWAEEIGKTLLWEGFARTWSEAAERLGD